jgi:hypothetical protein
MRCLLGVMLMFGFIGCVEAQAKPEKLYTVNCENTSWDKVIGWLEKEKPSGSITLKSDKKYTLGEVIDLLNERAEQDNYVLLRKSQSFSFYTADQRRVGEPYIVSRDDLNKRGKTEYVAVLILRRTLKAGVEKGDIKKLLSPFGDVQSFDSDLWLIRDRAEYVRNALAVFEITKPEQPLVTTVAVQPVTTVCTQPVVSCQPIQRFHLFPLRKCR